MGIEHSEMSEVKAGGSQKLIQPENKGTKMKNLESYLRSHPLDCSTVTSHASLLGFDAAQAEIGNFRCVAIIQEQVGWLQVSVKDRGFATVQVCHTATRSRRDALHQDPRLAQQKRREVRSGRNGGRFRDA